MGASNRKTLYRWLHSGYTRDFPISIRYAFCSELSCIGARDRNRTGTPVIHEAADFKSDVSTNFTTRAHDPLSNNNASPSDNDEALLNQNMSGGATRSRTGLTGFAIQGITDLLSRRHTFTPKEKGKHLLPLFLESGAGKESRTLDLNLGKVALYQLSYSRISSLKL